MARYLAGRLLQALVVVALVATLTFVLVHLAPGDPFAAAFDDSHVTEAVRQHWRAEFGLDRPLGEQYVRWLGGVARGDFGWSISRNEPVRATIARALPQTLLLMGVALTLSFAIGIAVGIVQAARRGRAADRALSGITLFFYSMPEFWVATVVLLAFAYWLPIFPSGGAVDPVMHDYLGPGGRLLDRLRHLALPALTQALVTTAAVARYQRSAVLDAVHEDWVRTARAKGLGERAVLVRHVLRNALLPVITLGGLAFPALLGGAVFVERVFSWPGMGLVAVGGIATRDYPLVCAVALVGSAMVALGAVAADVLHQVADPRQRVRRQ